jgi:putative endonuclease
MATKHALGKMGEQITAAYLEKYGFCILDRNFRIRGGEIDIIAKLEDLVVFVEVKTRNEESIGNYGTALESVDSGKIAHIIKTAKHWIYRNATDKEFNYRFDVAELIFRQNKLIKLNYIKSAFTE